MKVLYPILVLAIIASGARWTGTNCAYTAHELRRHILESNAEVVVVMSRDAELVQKALRIGPASVEIVIFTDLLQDKTPPGIPANYRTLHDYLRPADSQRLEERLELVDIDDPAILQSTSGTSTGLPKMAVRSHRAIMLETRAIADNHEAKDYEVRRLWCTAIFHAFSTPEMIFNAIRLGIPTYIMKRYDTTFSQKVKDFSITEIAAPPPMLNKMMHDQSPHGNLSGIRAILTGGTVLSPELRRRVLDTFPMKPRIVQIWGMTEGGWFATFKYPENDDTGSVGRLVSGLAIKLSPSDRLITADGQEAGELFVRGEQLMSGYNGIGTITSEAFTDGWLRTGDVGYVQDGKVYLIDRVKDLIKVNGFQVSPPEIENAVLQFDHVRDAAAISVGSGVNEHPMVFLVASNSITTQAIEGLLRERLARYKVAQIEIKFLDEIPRNHSGKISRRCLKMLAFEKGWIKE